MVGTRPCSLVWVDFVGYFIDLDSNCTNSNGRIVANRGKSGRGGRRCEQDLAAHAGDQLGELAVDHRRRLERLADRVDARAEFYSEKNSDEILALEPDYIFDAIDNIAAENAHYFVDPS